MPGTPPVRLALFATVLSAACGSPGTTLPSHLSAADSVVATAIDDGLVPGAVLLVREGGHVVFERAYGLARTEPDTVAMTVDTSFDLASVTKVMATTLAMMLLVERGEVEVDAPVRDVLPDFAGDGRGAITLRDLLTHRSGLPQWLPVYYHASNSEQAYQFIREVPLGWPVGQERHYSDLGFMLLGRVVEEVSGRPLDVYMRQEVYGPLGLNHTGFRRSGAALPPTAAGRFAVTSNGNPFERRMVHDPTFGYTIEGDPEAWNGWRDSWLDGEVNDGNAFHAFEGVAGHAGLFSTADELGTLLQFLLDGGRDQVGAPALGPDVVQHFLATTGDRQALGWQIPAYAPDDAFAHTGFTGTLVLGVPRRDLAVVLLTNRQNFGVDSTTSYPDVGGLQRAVTSVLTAPR